MCKVVIESNFSVFQYPIEESLVTEVTKKRKAGFSKVGEKINFQVITLTLPDLRMMQSKRKSQG